MDWNRVVGFFEVRWRLLRLLAHLSYLRMLRWWRAWQGVEVQAAFVFHNTRDLWEDIGIYSDKWAERVTACLNEWGEAAPDYRVEVRYTLHGQKYRDVFDNRLPRVPAYTGVGRTLGGPLPVRSAVALYDTAEVEDVTDRVRKYQGPRFEGAPRVAWMFPFRLGGEVVQLEADWGTTTAMLAPDDYLDHRAQSTPSPRGEPTTDPPGAPRKVPRPTPGFGLRPRTLFPSSLVGGEGLGGDGLAPTVDEIGERQVGDERDG